MGSPPIVVSWVMNALNADSLAEDGKWGCNYLIIKAAILDLDLADVLDKRKVFLSSCFKCTSLIIVGHMLQHSVQWNNI